MSYGSNYYSNQYYGGRSSVYGMGRWGPTYPYYYSPYYGYGYGSPYYSPYYRSPWGTPYYNRNPYYYSYYYGPGAIVVGGTLIVVRRNNYGCYSCANCVSCTDGCNSRTSCDASDSYEVQVDQDRYEFNGEGSSFIVPEASSDDWPLSLTIFNVTVFDKADANGAATPGGKPVLFNFYTEEGTQNKDLGNSLIGVGYSLLAISLISMMIAACMRRLCVSQGERPGGSSGGDGGKFEWKNKFGN